MRVLHVYNSHRNGGGSDNAWAETIRLSQAAGVETAIFSRDSAVLGQGLAGKVRAFTSGVYAAEAVNAFSEALVAFKPDIVHTHELFPFVSPWVLRRARQARVGVVHSCYDYRLTCPTAVHYQHGRACDACAGGHEHHAILNNCRDNLAESAAFALRSLVARKARLFEDNVDHFTVLSDDGADWLRQGLGVDAERITVVPCAVPTPAEAADPARGDYIAFAGRFVPEKGVEVLLEAARRAGLPVRLAGHAAAHPAIRPDDLVQCVLTPARDDLVDFYRGARMLVVPSLWREPFGIVAAEGMAHGLPLVASRVGGLAGMVVEGDTGFLVEPGDVGQLQDRLTRLWADADLRRTMGAAARARARTEFAPDTHMRRVGSAYEKVLNGPAARADRDRRPPQPARRPAAETVAG